MAGNKNAIKLNKGLNLEVYRFLWSGITSVVWFFFWLNYENISYFSPSLEHKERKNLHCPKWGWGLGIASNLKFLVRKKSEKPKPINFTFTWLMVNIFGCYR